MVILGSAHFFLLLSSLLSSSFFLSFLPSFFPSSFTFGYPNHTHLVPTLLHRRPPSFPVYPSLTHPHTSHTPFLCVAFGHRSPNHLPRPTLDLIHFVPGNIFDRPRSQGTPVPAHATHTHTHTRTNTQDSSFFLAWSNFILFFLVGCRVLFNCVCCL